MGVRAGVKDEPGHLGLVQGGFLIPCNFVGGMWIGGEEGCH